MINLCSTAKKPCLSFHIWLRLTSISIIVWTATSVVFAETILVTASNGAIDPEDKACSISEAIINANADDKVHGDCLAGKGDDIIVLPGNVTLEEDVDKTDGRNGTPSITSPLTLDGQGYSLSRSDVLMCTLNDTVEPGEFRLLHISGSGNLTLEDTTLANGCADGVAAGGYGGAVYNLGSLTVTNSTLLENAAGSSGGGISNHGNLYIISSSTLSRNSADIGGGIYNNSGIITTISNSILSGNEATYGGGIYNGYSAVLTSIINSTLSDNKATFGGGIYNGYSAALSNLMNSTLSGNRASFGGGVRNFGTLTTISNTTFSGNFAIYPGGGIYTEGTLTTILNTTFSGNSASSGGGMYIYSSAVGSLTNAIFTNTASGGDCALLNGGTITSVNNNLSSDNSCPGDIGNVTNFDNVLKDNGCVIPGPNGCIKTHALLAGSNAINAAVNGTASDQRGFSAIGVRDIGAYEFEFTSGGCFPYTPNGKTLMICW